jgi:hypothetical protein
VRRELANMLSIGIIKSDSSNNRLYYEINQEYTHYRPLRDIFVDSNLQSEAAVAVTEHSDWHKRLKPLGDVRVALFSGSLVRGSSTDVDVMLAGNINKTQAKKFLKELEEEEGHSLNYTIMSYEDFYYRISIKDKFVTEFINGKYTVLIDTEKVLTKE